MGKLNARRLKEMFKYYNELDDVLDIKKDEHGEQKAVFDVVVEDTNEEAPTDGTMSNNELNDLLNQIDSFTDSE